MTTLRILLCDDHPLVSAALADLVRREQGLELVGVAADGLEAVHLARELTPEVLVLDLSMPKLSGASVLAAVKSTHPQIKVLILSATSDEAEVRALLEAGAAGFVLKSTGTPDIVRAILAVGNGGTYVDAAVAGRLFSARPERTGSGDTRLSRRESEVLRYFAEGLALKEMAQKLDMSPRTLETYKARGMEKANLNSRAEVVRFALEQGWLKS